MANELATTNSASVINWTDPTPEKSERKPIPYLKKEDGDNIMRVVTPAVKWRAHSMRKDPTLPEEEDFKKQNLKDVHCSGVYTWINKVLTYQPGTCPCCDLELIERGKPKTGERYAFGVLSTKQNQTSYKINQCSWSEFDSIKKFSLNPDYGDPSTYELNLMRSKNKGKTVTTIMPRPKRPMNASEQAIVDSDADQAILDKMAAPRNAWQVFNQMTYVRKDLKELFEQYGLTIPANPRGEDATPAPAPVAQVAAPKVTPVAAAAKPAAKAAAKPTVSSKTQVAVVEDDGEDFPPYDA